VAEQLDRVCSRFEAAWDAVTVPENHPRIDDYLGNTPEPERSLLFRELEAINSHYLNRATTPASEPTPPPQGELVSASFHIDSQAEQPFSAGLLPSADPSSVAGYEIISLLGQGGMGIVYKARQIALQRVVALKMIRAGAHASEQDLKRFRTEAEAIARLEHPNIVQIHEIGEQGGLPFFSLEFCAGGSLEKKLSGTPLPAAEAAALLETLARAMQAAHDRGIIHRDLKPANILLASRGRESPAGGEAGDSRPRLAKISDFGLAKKLDEHGQTHSGAILGTPSYMAPEQASGKQDAVGPLSDVYSLGAILYECLTGRPPFRGATIVETLLMVQADDIIPPSRLNRNVPRDLETICLKCLEKDPARRYARAADLADDVQRYLDGRPIVARSASLFERAGKWCRRHPARAGLAGMGVALVAMLITGVILQWFAYQKLEAANEKESKARALAEQRAHDNVVAAAREAVTRSDWNVAVANFDSAIQDKRDDQLQLRVERLRCLFDFDHRPRLVAELDDLRQRTDLGPLASLVKLHHGDYLMSDASKAAEARGLIREALKEPEALTDADRAYAEGLLADNAADALRCYRLAIARNAFHHRALSALATGLLFTGQFDEARRQVDFMRRHHPRDPVSSFVLIWISILEGDEEAGREELKWLKSLLAQDRGAQVEAFFVEMRKALDTMVAVELGKLDWPAAILRLFGSQRRLAAFIQMGAEPFGFGVPGMERLIQTFSLASQATSLSELGLTGLALDRYRDAERLSLDGVIPSLAAVLRAKTVFQHIRGKRMPQARQEALLLIQDAYRAADTPTMLVRFPYRYQAHSLGIVADAMLLSDGVLDRSCAAAALVGGGPQLTSLSMAAVSDTPPRSIRLTEQVRRLAIDGRRYPAARAQVAGYLVDALSPDLSRVLLDDWQLDAPGDAAVLRLRARVEDRAGNPGAVLLWCEDLLSRIPGDREVLKLREKATEDLRKKLQSGGPSP
jgi:hypothetical protein